MQDKYEGKTLQQLAKSMASLKEKHSKLKAQAAEIWREHELLAKRLIPEMMEEMGIATVNLKGIGRLELRHDASVSVPPENKEAVYDWLRDNGYGDLIIGTVNSSTMRAQVKKWVEDGEDFPIDLIKYNPYDNAVLVKGK